MKIFQAVYRILYILQDLVSEALRFVQLTTRSQAALAAEILFLRKQLAFYQEREIKPRRFDDAARMSSLMIMPYSTQRTRVNSWMPRRFCMMVMVTPCLAQRNLEISSSRELVRVPQSTERSR